ncbi:MAG TPA: SDR family oxidoreductase [Dongiaceae bacterium]|jgi:NAD(P)-dependent dehydrogenase (short-subunit alcohol dehydrogenase family)
MAPIRDRIVIVGGTSGIGLAAARQLAGYGAEIIIAGRDEAKLRRALSEIGHGAAGRTVDAGDPAALKTFFSSLGPVDHLVLTLSGGEGAGPLKELDLAKLRTGFEAKFWAHIAAAQAALPYVKGSITFVTAASAGGHLPGTAGLAAINGALDAMVPVLAVELKPLRVNAVSPGAIDTPWWDKWPTDQKAALFNQIAATSPVGRVGKPEDVADAIAFVVRNSFVTGQVIQCDGGIQLG